jgi:hypothetical protein
LTRISEISPNLLRIANDRRLDRPFSGAIKERLKALVEVLADLVP